LHQGFSNESVGKFSSMKVSSWCVFSLVYYQVFRTDTGTFLKIYVFIIFLRCIRDPIRVPRI